MACILLLQGIEEMLFTRRWGRYEDPPLSAELRCGVLRGRKILDSGCARYLRSQTEYELHLEPTISYFLFNPALRRHGLLGYA